MGLPPAGIRDVGGGISGGVYLCLPLTENSRTFYCGYAHYGPVSSGIAEARVKVDQALVGAGHIGCGVDVDGVSGGGTDGGERGYGQEVYGYRLSRWEDNVAHVTLGVEPNAPLAYAPVLEHHHPIMSMIGYPGGRLERLIEIFPCENWIYSLHL